MLGCCARCDRHVRAALAVTQPSMARLYLAGCHRHVWAALAVTQPSMARLYLARCHRHVWAAVAVVEPSMARLYLRVVPSARLGCGCCCGAEHGSALPRAGAIGTFGLRSLLCSRAWLGSTVWGAIGTFGLRLLLWSRAWLGSTLRGAIGTFGLRFLLCSRAWLGSTAGGHGASSRARQRQITVRLAYAITSHLLPASANSTCTRACCPLPS